MARSTRTPTRKLSTTARRGAASETARVERRGTTKATGPRNPNVTVRKTNAAPTASKTAPATGRSLRKTVAAAGAQGARRRKSQKAR
jgi:hypothetical protein